MGITVLVVDDEVNARSTLESFLTSLDYDVIGVGTLGDAREELKKGNADLVLLDVQLPDGFGPTLLYESAYFPNNPPIILITGVPDIEIAVDAMKNGALDYITKPIKLERLELTIKRAVELVRMRRQLFLFQDIQRKNFKFVPSNNKELQQVYNLAQRAAMASASVLISGETGVGKDILAQYIYHSGPRKDKMFVAINCGAIQSTMLESELFGHEANSFTSADKRKLGLMETADGGVLFLDEISSMAMDIQAKLLRAIETQSFRRLGGTQEIHVDVQLIAASNRNLLEMIAKNEFREDLYYRLKVIDLEIPALRDRKEDIPELVGFLIKLINSQRGLNVEDITPRALEAIIAYDWPGNVRELSHVLEFSMISNDSGVIDLNDIPYTIIRKKN
ncbi:MAG: hypothetical protein BGO78_01885 [Chloroflexi bacterium 44-23]|nr:MAG: hypothetical protein BGO78_01885 [Chloroflexi bacterium 44-23]